MSSLILLGVDTEQVNAIFEKLENNGKANQVLKQALNETAKQARERLSEQTKKVYAIKKTAFRKDMKIKKATVSKPQASIVSTGRANSLSDFRVSPATVRNGNNRPKITKGKVLKSSRMKGLEKGGIKAFLVKFKSGHKAAVERTSKKRLPIRVLYSPSDPVMIGSEKRTYGIVEPYIERDLHENLRRFIEQALGG